jgi:arginine:pyruvate transaminase
VLSDAEADGIAALARRHGVWVVSDEVYGGIAEGGRVPSLGARLPEQTLTIASLSKTHAMTGWRTGWVIGPTDFVRGAEDLAICMLYGLPGFIQEAAVTALAMAAEAENSMREYCRQRRDILHGVLTGVPGIRPCWPDAGMFMLIDVRGTGVSSADFIRNLYHAEGVSVLDGAVFGRETEGFVRASFAVEVAAIEDGARRIRRYCESLAAPR